MGPIWIARSIVEEGSIVTVKQITGRLMLHRESTLTMDGSHVGNGAAFLGIE